MIETRNAIIKSARITNDDHGILTIWIDLDYGGTGQGFGGYALYLPEAKTDKSRYNYCGHFIWRVLQVVGVGEWSQLPGKTVRAVTEHNRVHAIGHIIKDDWFNPQDEFAKWT